MSDPVDLLPYMDRSLADVREILSKMTPAERAEAEEEARAKGVTVEVLLLRAIGTLVRQAELDELKRRDVQTAKSKLPHVGRKAP